MKEVKSSNIKLIGYDSDTNTLGIVFKNLSHFEYSDVPQNIYDELCKADSIGAYFHTNIKNKFASERKGLYKP